MAAFGTNEWISATAGRVADAEVDPDLSLVLEQELTDTGAAWHIVVAGGTVRMQAGTHAAPTVRLRATAAIAGAVHRGELSAQRAFLDGELQIGGETNALIEHRSALSTIAALLAP